jgi:hypothetical protein
LAGEKDLTCGELSGPAARSIVGVVVSGSELSSAAERPFKGRRQVMGNATRNAVGAVVITLALLSVAHTAGAAEGNAHCSTVGGLIMTNFGVIDANTTLGSATGDLRGGVSATILSITGTQSAPIFNVQHHWVTESGDTIFFGQVKASGIQVLDTAIYGVTFEPLRITGGTGRFQGAAGVLNTFGSADLGTGRTAFRYTGNVCVNDHAEQH